MFAFFAEASLPVSKNNRRRLIVIAPSCESIEPRLYLSAADFAGTQMVSVPGAHGPLVAGQFNGAGNPVDLAVATPTAVQVLTGSANGTFSAGGVIPLPANPAAQSPFQVGDFSGSGSADIVLDSFDTATGDADITYVTSNGDGTFTGGAVSTITDGGVGFTPLSGAVGDFNGDGEDDLAIIGKPATGNLLVLAILTSNGDGTFTETQDYPIESSVAAGTITDEQVLTGITNEVIINDGSSGNLDVFNGTGDGTFTQMTPTPVSATLVALDTFNGNQDLVVSSGDAIALLDNQNDGTFQPDPQGPIDTGGPVEALSTGDFNLDGNRDIITNQGIIFGNDDGTFDTSVEALPTSINGGNNFSGTMQAVDILGNGKPGFVGFSAAGNAVVSAVNESPAGVLIDLESNNNPAAPASDVQLTATVSPADPDITDTPTGEVAFFNGATQIGMEPLVNGTATFDAGSSLDSGANSITAGYSGDSEFAADTSMPLIQATPTATTTAAASNENPSSGGDDVIFVATVSGNDGLQDVPTGNVEFFDNGNDLGGGSLDGTGVATFDTAGSLSVGDHSITTQYQGDTNYAPSQSDAFTQTVTPPGLVPLVTATTLPSAIIGGAKLHGNVTVSLTNQTQGVESVGELTIFASPDGSIADATAVTSVIHHPAISIKAGQQKVVKVAVKSLPSTISDGSYLLLVQAAISSGKTISSSTGPSVDVAAPFVQLDGTAGTGTVKPTAVKAGKSTLLTIALTNSGNVITTPATVDVGLTIDGQTESVDLETVNEKIKIKPGHAGVLHLRLKISSTISTGAYQPIVTISDDGSSSTVVGQSFSVV